MLRPYELENARIAPTAPVSGEIVTATEPPLLKVRTGELVAELFTFKDEPFKIILQPSRLRSAERVIGVPSNSKIVCPDAVVPLVGRDAPLFGST